MPDTAHTAILLIDVINDFEFPGGAALFREALPASHRIKKLKVEAMRAGIPSIYANDNFGRWQSDFHDVLDHCLHDQVRGQRIAEVLRPGPDDYFVLKPKHSAFFATTLETLLRYLGTRRLILTGFAADICVLFSANDAYMRDFEIVVPEDCVASESPSRTRMALDLMRSILRTRTTPSDHISLEMLGPGPAPD